MHQQGENLVFQEEETISGFGPVEPLTRAPFIYESVNRQALATADAVREQASQPIGAFKANTEVLRQRARILGSLSSDLAKVLHVDEGLREQAITEQFHRDISNL